MKVGIMQPYFMPYIGYWQLIDAVDTYVIYDDVNFIKGGGINRNRILLDGVVRYLNVPLKGASSFKKINDISVNDDKRIVKKSLRMIESAYRKAPFFENIYPMIESILLYEETNLAKYLGKSIERICGFMGIKSKIVYSSALNKNANLRGEKKVLEICHLLGATDYYNAIGGENMYSYTNFKSNGIRLGFLKTNNISYRQFGDMFKNNLSIIDVLMFNSKLELPKLIQNYCLIGENDK